MKLLRLVTIFVLLQISLVSQAAEMHKPVMQEQSNPARIQVVDKASIASNASAANSTDINTEIRLQTIGVKKLTKTDWGTAIVERKLHLRDGVFSLILHSKKLYS